jgi:fatty acid desaturase
LALIGACYLVWGLATALAPTSALGLAIAIAVTALAVTLHSSLQHEAIHGHPTASQPVNDAVVFPAIGLLVPYERFRAIHSAHHRGRDLTDPLADPESNFLTPAAWRRLSAPVRGFMALHNTLAGRMVLGPAVATIRLVYADGRAVAAGDRAVARAWALHALGLIPVAAWLILVAEMPIWAYLLAAYLGNAILKIRTFAEHRAHADQRGRSVIIEDKGPLALLFLNNNLHAVHHAHPHVAWYRLPALYRRQRASFLKRNGGYRFPSYAALFRRYLVRAKDPVAHPLANAEAPADPVARQGPAGEAAEAG